MVKKYYDNDLLNHIKFLMDQGKFEGALHKINEYKKLYPNDKIINIYLSRVYSEYGKYEEAEKLCLDVIYDKVHRVDITKEAYLSLGFLYEKLQKYDEAIDAFNMAYDLSGRTKQTAQLGLSRIYMVKGNLDKAYEVLLEEHDSRGDIILNLQKAKVLFEKKKYMDAANILKKLNDNLLKALSLQEKYYYLGRIYLIFHQPKRALDYFKNALRLKNDTYYYTYYYMAQIYSSLGNIDDTISICEEVVENIKSCFAKELLIETYLKKGEYLKAEKLIDTLNEYYKEYYYGLLFLNKGDYYVSLNYFNKCLDGIDYSYMANVKVFLATIYYRLGKLDEMKKQIGEVLKYNLEVTPEQKSNYLALLTYCKLSNNEEIVPDRYTDKQIINYSDKEALRHVISHHYLNRDNSCFSSKEELLNIFNNIDDYLSDSQKIISGVFDSYIINYNKIGICSEIFMSKQSNQVVVVTLPNTHNIITMYPTKNDDMIIEEEKKEVKVKKMSQIEKFYKRYGSKKNQE